LIDQVLASGTKQGYHFRIFRPAGKKSEFLWWATAAPTVPGTTGRRWLGIDAEGNFYYHTERPILFAPDGSSKDPALGN
jgi:hypothetical protein